MFYSLKFISREYETLIILEFYLNSFEIGLYFISFNRYGLDFGHEVNGVVPSDR